MHGRQPRGVRFTLTVNRRSKPVILDVANQPSPRPLRADRRLLVGRSQPTAAACCAPPTTAAVAPCRPRASTPGRRKSPGWPTGAGDHRTGQSSTGPRSRCCDGRTPPSLRSSPSLVERDVPVEIVGLGGCWSCRRSPTWWPRCTLIDDVTANPEVVRLLSGPAMADRAARSAAAGAAGRPGPGARIGSTARRPTVTTLADIGEPAWTPAESVCLLDAVEDLGEAPLSTIREAAGGLRRRAARSARPSRRAAPRAGAPGDRHQRDLAGAGASPMWTCTTRRQPPARPVRRRGGRATSTLTGMPASPGCWPGCGSNWNRARDSTRPCRAATTRSSC